INFPLHLISNFLSSVLTNSGFLLKKVPPRDGATTDGSAVTVQGETVPQTGAKEYLTTESEELSDQEEPVKVTVSACLSPLTSIPSLMHVYMVARSSRNRITPELLLRQISDERLKSIPWEKFHRVPRQ